MIQLGLPMPDPICDRDRRYHRRFPDVKPAYTQRPITGLAAGLDRLKARKAALTPRG